MARQLTGKLGLMVAGATTALCLSQAKPAHAERVISDYEASMLTLDALTAVPVVHHVSYHHAAVQHTSRGATHSHAALSSRAQVRTVAYHVKAPAHAAHPATAHKRHHT